jgi:hypothetical protein
LSNSRAKSFGSGFLRGKSGGEWDGRTGLRTGIFDFRRMKNLLEEPIPKTLKGFLNPVDFDQIHAKAEDSFGIHFFLMARRKSRTLRSRPTLMAWETRECPMFSV